MNTVFRRSTVLALVALATASLAVFVVASATASTKKKTANVQVCVLLPDTKSSVRWVQFDAPDLKAAFKKAGVTASINNALNDPLKQKAQAQACIAAGATVVIETALDNGSAASIEKLFTSKGGKAIDYDRQVTGGTASVYVTFDGKAVGKAQAAGVISAMKAKKTYPGGTVAQLWGGQTDQNAYWFQSGNLAVFNPLFATKKIKRGPQQFVPDWDANNAATIFSQMLVKTNNHIQGVLGGERQHRRRGDRRSEGEAPQPDPALRAGCVGGGCPEHHLRLADGHGVQVRARRGEGCRRCCGRAPQGQDAEVERDSAERQASGADLCAAGGLDHQGQLQAPLLGQVVEGQRSVHRLVQAVLQVSK